MELAELRYINNTGPSQVTHHQQAPLTVFGAADKLSRERALCI